MAEISKSNVPDVKPEAPSASPAPAILPEDVSGKEESSCLGSFHSAFLWMLSGVPTTEYSKVVRKQRYVS